MINIGVIGAGHWGPNHIRIFNQLADSEVAMCADLGEERLCSVKALFPRIEVTTDYRDILNSGRVQAVCIATPTDTHFQLTREALEKDKHVLCEKPLAMSPEECLVLKDLAEKRKKVLMVGHVFVFNTGILRLKDYLDKKELGRVLYAHSERTNLGPFRYDVNALWDLAPHDISIFNFLFGRPPAGVSARGSRCLGETREDLAFVTLDYPDNILVNVHVSWLDPRKVRQITIIGDEKMVSWDDLDNIGPVRLYDKHVERTSTYYESYGEFQLLSKEGSITIPKVPASEPLKSQNQYFLECVRKDEPPLRADARAACDVARTLRAVQDSIDLGGQFVPVQ